MKIVFPGNYFAQILLNYMKESTEHRKKRRRARARDRKRERERERERET